MTEVKLKVVYALRRAAFAVLENRVFIFKWKADIIGSCLTVGSVLNYIVCTENLFTICTDLKTH